MKRFAATLVAVLLSAIAIRAQPPRPASSQPPQGWPNEFTFCNVYCNTFVWDDGHYINTTLRSFKFRGDSVWTFDVFTPESVQIHRKDTSSGYNATYTGKIAPDGHSILNGTIDGRSAPFKMTWAGTGARTAATAQNSIATAQTPSSSPSRGSVANQQMGSAPSRPAGWPAEISYCIQFCGTFTWDNGQYVNLATQSPEQVADSTLTIERFLPESVILHRKDKSSGYSATYTGTISADGKRLLNGAINGNHGPFTMTFESKATHTPTLTAATPPEGWPEQMHFCAMHCATFKWTQGRYLRVGGSGMTEFRVETFTPDLVKIYRTDTGNGLPTTATMTGRMSGDHNGVDNGLTTNTTAQNYGATAAFTLSWGAALDRVAGSDEESLTRAGGCDAAASKQVPVDVALARAQQTIGVKRFRETGCWWQIAADQGDVEAQFLVGIWYKSNEGGRRDELGDRWVKRSADGGLVRARDYLVCSSPAVENAMIALLVALPKDEPNVFISQALIKAFTGLSEKETIHKVGDINPYDAKSADDFGCMATIEARREVKMTDENGNKDTLIDPNITSAVPIIQTYRIKRGAFVGTYIVTLPYLGSEGALKIPVSHPWSSPPVQGPTWK